MSSECLCQNSTASADVLSGSACHLWSESGLPSGRFTWASGIIADISTRDASQFLYELGLTQSRRYSQLGTQGRSTARLNGQFGLARGRRKSDPRQW